MASIQILNGKNGKPMSCRFRCVVGREDSGRQIFRTTTVPYPDTLTPAKAKKQLMIQADIWENAEKERYNSGTAVGNVGIKESMSFKQFAEEYWMTDFVRDGMHTPATTAYYEFTLRIVLAYFGNTIKLDELRPEHVKRFMGTSKY